MSLGEVDGNSSGNQKSNLHPISARSVDTHHYFEVDTRNLFWQGDLHRFPASSGNWRVSIPDLTDSSGFDRFVLCRCSKFAHLLKRASVVHQLHNDFLYGLSSWRSSESVGRKLPQRIRDSLHRVRRSVIASNNR